LGITYKEGQAREHEQAEASGKERSDGMKVQIVFDSAYGNTERIAKAIGDAVGGEVEVINVKESAGKTIPADVLLVGSPTYGGKPTPAIQDFMNGLAGDSLKGIDVAAFDTRLSTRLVKVFGYAADKIAADLKAKGGEPVLPPGGFLVKGRKGPLKEGELERAAAWAKEISAA